MEKLYGRISSVENDCIGQSGLQIQQSPSELHCSLHRGRENRSAADTEAQRDPHCRSNSKQEEQRAGTKAGLELERRARVTETRLGTVTQTDIQASVIEYKT